MTSRDAYTECPVSLDVAILLDATESMDYDYDVTQTLARRITVGLNFASNQTRLAIVTFQVDATLRFGLDTYFGRVRICGFSWL